MMDAIVEKGDLKLPRDLVVPEAFKAPLTQSETVLKTGRLEEMRTWYRIMLGVEPSIENTPNGDQYNADGTPRGTGLRVCFFEFFENYPHLQAIGLIEVPNTSLDPSENSPGLHHFQFQTGSLKAMLERFDAAAALGILPSFSMNHSLTMSMYYHDPDKNIFEITANNFATYAEYRAHMNSQEFLENFDGAFIDPYELKSRFEAGQTLAQLQPVPAWK